MKKDDFEMIEKDSYGVCTICSDTTKPGQCLMKYQAHTICSYCHQEI